MSTGKDEKGTTSGLSLLHAYDDADSEEDDQAGKQEHIATTDSLLLQLAVVEENQSPQTYLAVKPQNFLFEDTASTDNATEEERFQLSCESKQDVAVKDHGQMLEDLSHQENVKLKSEQDDIQSCENDNTSMDQTPGEEGIQINSESIPDVTPEDHGQMLEDPSHQENVKAQITEVQIDVPASRSVSIPLEISKQDDIQSPENDNTSMDQTPGEEGIQINSESIPDATLKDHDQMLEDTSHKENVKAKRPEEQADMPVLNSSGIMPEIHNQDDVQSPKKNNTSMDQTPGKEGLQINSGSIPDMTLKDHDQVMEDSSDEANVEMPALDSGGIVSEIPSKDNIQALGNVHSNPDTTHSEVLPENKALNLKSQLEYRESDTSDSDEDSSDDSSSDESVKVVEKLSSSEAEEDEPSAGKGGKKAKKKPTPEEEYCPGFLPAIEDLTISVEEKQCVHLGKVTSIIDKMVVVQADKNTPALDEDSVLFLESGRKTLGRIFDTFGCVSEPSYVVRFNSVEHVQQRAVEVGMDVYCAPQTEHSHFVLISQLLKMKGTDASWKNDIEVPQEMQEYSDDEQERAARRARKSEKATYQVEVEIEGEIRPPAKRGRGGPRQRGVDSRPPRGAYRPQTQGNPFGSRSSISNHGSYEEASYNGDDYSYDRPYSRNQTTPNPVDYYAPPNMHRRHPEFGNSAPLNAPRYGRPDYGPPHMNHQPARPPSNYGPPPMNHQPARPPSDYGPPPHMSHQPAGPSDYGPPPHINHHPADPSYGAGFGYPPQQRYPHPPANGYQGGPYPPSANGPPSHQHQYGAPPPGATGYPIPPHGGPPPSYVPRHGYYR